MQAGKKEIWIWIRGVKIAGVYRRGEEGVSDIQDSIQTMDVVVRDGPRVGLGD